MSKFVIWILKKIWNIKILDVIWGFALYTTSALWASVVSSSRVVAWDSIFFPFLSNETLYKSAKYFSIRQVRDQYPLNPHLWKMSFCFPIDFLLISWFAAKLLFYFCGFYLLLGPDLPLPLQKPLLCLRTLHLNWLEFLLAFACASGIIADLVGLWS